MGRRVERMPFVLLKIKMLFVNVHRDTKAIQYQKLDANWPTHVRTVPNHRCVKYRRLDNTFASAHKDTLDTLKQLDVIQSVNVQMVILIAQIQHDVRMAVALTNAMVYAAPT